MVDIENIPLTQLRVGEKGVITQLAENDLTLKLMEMGCLPGEGLTVTGKAPLGDPISIKLHGYTLSLRLDEACNIFIAKLP